MYRSSGAWCSAAEVARTFAVVGVVVVVIAPSKARRLLRTQPAKETRAGHAGSRKSAKKGPGSISARLAACRAAQRIHIDGLPLHIVQRGHNRAACFFDDQDRLAYLGWLHEALERERCSLHAYVLMTNHLHLLLTPEQANCVPQVLISVGRRYVQYINHSYGRTGTLWDGRYKSSLVQAETYLLLCQRYIEQNPVRAGMVADPADYRWSSYRANALGASDTLLSPHSLYLALGADGNARRATYRELFRGALDEKPLSDLRLALNQDQPIGNDRFYREIEAMTGRWRELRRRGRPRKRDEEASAGDAGQGELPLKLSLAPFSFWTYRCPTRFITADTPLSLAAVISR
jgi:putative transposase